jgi:hypothetical protein
MRWVETKEERKKFTPMNRRLSSSTIDVKNLNDFVFKKSKIVVVEGVNANGDLSLKCF